MHLGGIHLCIGPLDDPVAEKFWREYVDKQNLPMALYGFLGCMLVHIRECTSGCTPMQIIDDKQDEISDGTGRVKQKRKTKNTNIHHEVDKTTI